MSVETKYVSEFGLWLNEKMSENVHWQKEQQQGRAIWWDKLDTNLPDKLKNNDKSVAIAKPYPYDVNFFNSKDSS